MSYLSTLPDGSVALRLHVQPKASKSRIVGLHDDRLKISIAAPPVEGKANTAVVKFLAQILGIADKNVILKSGVQSRQKLVIVKSLGVMEIRNILDQKL